MSSNPLRLAFIVTILKKNGPVCVVSTLCTKLLERGDVQIKVFYFDESEESIIPPGVPVERIGMGSQIPFEDFDVVHTHMLRSDLYMAVHWLQWRRTKCRWVSTIHQETFKNQASRLGFGPSLVLTPVWYVAWLFASGIACVSKKVRGQHPYAYARVVYNGIPDVSKPATNDVAYRHVQALRKKFKTIGSCAGVVRIKGFEQIVRALPLMPEYLWVLIGDGPELPSIKKLAAELNVLDRCVFMGYRADPTAFYPLIDVFVLSSRSEGCCQAGLEANAAGLPLALSPLPTFKEIYKQGEVCEYFEFDDPNSIVAAVYRAYKNRDSYGRASRILYENLFTDEIMADNYIKFYKRVMA